MSLRPSQIETLQAVERHEHDGDYGPGAAPSNVARALDRKRDSVEESLTKLEERGYVKAVFYPLLSAVYVLTPKGREAIEDV
jgi:DNA-binding MarR family transcriptional regulator